MLSGIILSKNEENNIEACIKSLSFCNEILVIDDNSDDNTVSIAKKLGVKVLIRNLNADFAGQHNFAAEKADGEWVLFVDADERVSKNLANEIKRNLKQDRYDVFVFKRIDHMWGKWIRHGECGYFRSARLYKKGAGKWVRSIHEYFSSHEKSKLLKNPILHYSHQTIKEFINKINIWSSWHAFENNKENKHSTLIKIIIFPIGHFLFNYVLRLGFLDGMYGFVFAIIMASHSFLSWSKLWMLQKGYTKI
jgi:glycosyltransferase involved in cell wall biosynthesis